MPVPLKFQPPTKLWEKMNLYFALLAARVDFSQLYCASPSVSDQSVWMFGEGRVCVVPFRQQSWPLPREFVFVPAVWFQNGSVHKPGEPGRHTIDRLAQLPDLIRSPVRNLDLEAATGDLPCRATSPGEALHLQQPISASNRYTGGCRRPCARPAFFHILYHCDLQRKHRTDPTPNRFRSNT